MCEQVHAVLCAWSSNGIHVQGNKASIDAVDAAFHSHGQIEELKRSLRHWREECGKLHAGKDALVKALEASTDALKEAREWVTKAPAETWGMNAQGDYDVPGGVASWPIRDELAHNIGTSEIAAREALAQVRP